MPSLTAVNHCRVFALQRADVPVVPLDPDTRQRPNQEAVVDHAAGVLLVPVGARGLLQWKRLVEGGVEGDFDGVVSALFELVAEVFGGAVQDVVGVEREHPVGAYRGHAYI